MTKSDIIWGKVIGGMIATLLLGWLVIQALDIVVTIREIQLKQKQIEQTINE